MHVEKSLKVEQNVLAKSENKKRKKREISSHLLPLEFTTRKVQTMFDFFNLWKQNLAGPTSMEESPASSDKFYITTSTGEHFLLFLFLGPPNMCSLKGIWCQGNLFCVIPNVSDSGERFKTAKEKEKEKKKRKKKKNEKKKQRERTKCFFHSFLFQTIIEDDATLRGDLARITVGKYCLIGSSSLLFLSLCPFLTLHRKTNSD